VVATASVVVACAVAEAVVAAAGGDSGSVLSLGELMEVDGGEEGRWG